MAPSRRPAQMNEPDLGQDRAWPGDLAGVHVLSQQVGAAGGLRAEPRCSPSLRRLASAPGQRARGPGRRSDAGAAGEPVAAVADAAGAAGQGCRAGGARPREEGPVPEARGV